MEEHHSDLNQPIDDWRFFGNCCFKSSDFAIKSILTSMNLKEWKSTFVLQAIWRYEQPQTFETRG